MPTKLIVNCKTGQTEEVELTADEIAQMEADAAAAAEQQAAMEAELAAKQAAKESALAKLEALGLTADEVSAAFGI